MPKRAVNAGDAPRNQVQVDLALQGGGSHGAFTWGVLDRLLEEPWLKIEAISGASAGAMNGAVLVSGYMQGGAAGARTALDAYWGRVAEAARLSPFQRSPLDRLMNRWSLDISPAYLAMDLMSRMISPYSLNPFGHNPISEIIEKSIDFAHLGEASIKLFITATNVHTGRGRVFRSHELTPAVLLASACLPTMFQAIEIDGEPYWDGGFVGNPTITPLVRESDALDVILVQINPRVRLETPRTASQILNRLNEISLQLAADEGIAHDRASPAGRRPGYRRGRALGAHAHAPDRHRQARRIRGLVEAQRRGRIPVVAEGGGPARRRRLSPRARRRPRKAVDGRPRRAAGRGLRR